MYHETTEKKTVGVALRWVEAKNQHNMMMLYQITHPDAIFHFPDTNVHLPMRPFWDSMMALFDAVPDLSFTYSSFSVVEPGVVCFREYIGFGHHTGDAMELSPDHPRVPATGAYIADEPIHLTVTIKNGRVFDMVAETAGGLAGPPGFYFKAKAAFEARRGPIQT